MDLKHLKFLRYLNLNFINCSQVSDEGLKRISACIVNHSKLVSSLLFSFRRCGKITHERIQSLISGLTNLKSLQSLSLDLGYCSKVSDATIKKLSLIIKRFKSLSTLILSFNDCAISDDGLQSLAVSLKNLQSLLVLSLNFSSQEICNGGFHSLCDAIKHLKLLSKLNHSFNECLKLNTQAIETLSCHLKKSEILSALSMSFFSYKHINAENLKMTDTKLYNLKLMIILPPSGDKLIEYKAR